MRRITLILPLLAAACSAQAPAPLTEAFNAVNQGHHYQNYAKKDYTPMHAGEGGNCARFAGTYQQELAKRGIKSDTAQCVLRNGTGHAFTITEDGWVLDVRQRWVGRFEDVGCRIP